MNRRCVVFSVVAAVLLLSRAVYASNSSVYQYATQLDNRTAYLWIPPSCRNVRGALISIDNLTERKWLEDPAIRAVATEKCLGTIWIGPANGREKTFNADMKPGSGEALQGMFKAFAEKTGFPELEYVPVIPMGHSAHGQFSWKFPLWAPERTIAAIPVKAGYLPEDLHMPGVPLLYIMGENIEWPQYDDGRVGDRTYLWRGIRDSAVNARMTDNENLIGVVTSSGGGHFEWSEADSKIAVLFIRKACQYRLPEHASKNGPVILRSIRAESGWLTDTAELAPDKWPPASYKHYRGDPKTAFWFFDREMALAAVAFDGDRVQRKKQMLSFMQNGQLVPVAKLGYADLRLEAEEDGITFKLLPTFLPVVPKELVGAGEPLGHANGPIHLSVTVGSAEQIGPNEFRVAMGRGNRDAWIEEEKTGDAEFSNAFQPGKVKIPETLTQGIKQSINFDPIATFQPGSDAIQLRATATSGLPVRFYVEYGPARVDGDRLILAEVPRYATRLIEVKVVAYQWGRMPGIGDLPAVQSAESVARTFSVAPQEHVHLGL